MADMDDVRKLAEQLLDWNSRKVKHLQAVSAEAKEGTTFIVGGEKVVANKREAAFFQLGIEAAIIEIGTLPIKLTAQKPLRKRVRACE